MLRWNSFFGLIALLLIAWCFSDNRRKMDWRLILSGIVLQFLLGGLLIKTVVGDKFFDGANTFVTKIIEFSNIGAEFMFGKELVSSTIAFSILPTIIFVATLAALLFHLGILQLVVRVMAWVMIRLMNASGVESFASAANVFVGHIEAPMLVRPYLADATRSELMTILTAGMATIAGGVMAAYVGMGANAGHLMTASLMSAPAAIVLAKIMIPETQVSPTRGRVAVDPPRTAVNCMDAVCQGASDGLILALNVGVMLLAAVSLIALFNWIVSPLPDINGSPVTLQRVCGWIFAPLACLLGLPREDVLNVAGLLGEKTVLNEFVAYADLMAMNTRGELTERGFILAQYALCGFANFGSMAIAIGGLSPLIPERRTDLAQLAPRALVAGTLAALMTACVAGVFI